MEQVLINYRDKLAVSNLTETRQRANTIFGNLDEIHDFRMTIVASEENLGFGAACNRGAAVHSRARHVLFLNADTVMRPGAAQGIVDALEAVDAQRYRRRQ